MDAFQKLLDLRVEIRLYFLVKPKIKVRGSVFAGREVYRSGGHTVAEGKTNGWVLGQLLSVFSPVFDQRYVARCLPLGLEMRLDR